MNPNPKEKWGSKAGLILAVASGAIGLGNFLRFPGQAVKNGGGAFMLPYIISFILLGVPVCLSEWIMGRIGGKNGHSAPHIFSTLLGKGFSAKFASTIALIVPTIIYVYYVFIEAWCLTYALDFLFGNLHFVHEDINIKDSNFSSQIVSNSTEYFLNLVGTKYVGAAFESKILFSTLLCYSLNFLIVYRGLSKGIEALAKFGFPLLMMCSFIILGRVLTLDDISYGLGFMWNPNWEALTKGEVWIAAAGQIFFSLSVGFGITLLFTSYLTEKDDVTLSGLTAASLNEFVEVGFGGMITIPIGFLFLGAAVGTFGTFGMGFIALPAVFAQMPFGNFFGALWFFVLFLAAITSSVTMLHPGISLLEEGFHMKRRNSVFTLFGFTLILTMGILYYNYDFTALDYTDFWVGTLFIYILATIQVIAYGWKIGPKVAREHAQKGSLWEIPKIFDFVIKYITPGFLLLVMIVFIYQSAGEYVLKLNPIWMKENASQFGLTPEQAELKAKISLGVVSILGMIFLFTFYLVHKIIERDHKHE